MRDLVDFILDLTAMIQPYTPLSFQKITPGAEIDCHFGMTESTLELLKASKNKAYLYDSELGKLKWIKEKLLPDQEKLIVHIHDVQGIEKMASRLAFSQVNFYVAKGLEDRHAIFQQLVENERFRLKELAFGLDQGLLILAKNTAKTGYRLVKKSVHHQPVMIIGAGPSLSVHLEEIKANKDRALIFASLHALDTLVENGIRPDAVGVIDPRHEIRFRCPVADIPCFHTLLARSSQLECFDYLIPYPVKSDFPLSKSFEELRFKSEHYADYPQTVVGFLWSIAQSCKASSITLYGVDLAYLDGIKYCHPFQHPREGLFSYTDESGQAYETKLDFLLCKKWLELECEKHRIPCINRSKGLFLKGFETHRPDFPNCLKKKLKFFKRGCQAKKLQLWLDQVTRLKTLPLDTSLEQTLFFSDCADLGLLDPLEEIFERLETYGFVKPEDRIGFFNETILKFPISP